MSGERVGFDAELAPGPHPPQAFAVPPIDTRDSDGFRRSGYRVFSFSRRKPGR